MSEQLTAEKVLADLPEWGRVMFKRCTVDHGPGRAMEKWARPSEGEHLCRLLAEARGCLRDLYEAAQVYEANSTINSDCVQIMRDLLKELDNSEDLLKDADATSNPHSDNGVAPAATD